MTPANQIKNQTKWQHLLKTQSPVLNLHLSLPTTLKNGPQHVKNKNKTSSRPDIVNGFAATSWKEW
jgi:hypothetical protein